MKYSYTYLFGGLLLLSSCYGTRKSKGGGQIGTILPRTIVAEDIALPAGYRIEAVAVNLTFPAATNVDAGGNLYVLEAGYSYGEVFQTPKLLRIGADGQPATILEGTKNGPWNSLVFHEGYFYISEGGQLEEGRIFRVRPDGSDKKILVENLPSLGDHHTDNLVIKDGYIYFGQGTATNSGVVGPDNYQYGWLKRHPDFHDIPCRDITLIGQNYISDNPLTENANDEVETGAYLPFGQKSAAGQVIKGRVPCTGAIMRIPLEGGEPEAVAWGLRNPYGLALAPDGKIYISENGYDDRGSRPIWGTGDVLYELKQDMWYGWPDFSGGKKIAGWHVPGKGTVKPVIKEYPNTPPKPVAVFGVHASSNGMDFSSSDAFGFKGELFVAEFGDMAPTVGKVLNPVGFKVLRANVQTGVLEDFAVNKSKKNAPASKLKKGGLERPLSVKFSPDGKSLYVTDFGIVKMTKKGPQPQTGTGVVWKITRP